ncbi:urease accessory protein UreD [Kineosporia rhizophila]|uniref:urease accessory protein UreD n=1 Tax=Kineosporia TaxID=49184 RepID=UPI001E31F0BA|nr:urease accessory protein UreD [Kineosporia sp. NBRC 101677]MCE0539242.1 urease accessory protein UreD [Kineosporia rhizophila]GLY14487.1 urease accessory protein UreD [Kineosporia sp. NBRC 101677]
MDSRLEIVAVARGANTVVQSIRGGGHFAARQTGAGVVHLVGTAAGPLGGDRAVVDVQVGPGARLSVRSAGATIIQPGRMRPDSVMELNLRVDDGGWLDLAPEPTVVCHGAQHESRTTVSLSGDGQARLVEQVLLGRAYEGPGEWSGRTVITRDGAPVLRHTLRSRVVAVGGTRVISTLARSDLAGAVPATSGDAVAMPLTGGGLLVTATGADLLPVQADLLSAESMASGHSQAVPAQ